MTVRSYRIGDMPASLADETLKKLQQVEVATIGHYVHDRIANNNLKPVTSGKRIAGTAVTLSIPGADSTLLYHAMDRVRPGDVLVIDRGGDHRNACFGGFMAAVARIRGLAGVIVDGAVTDPAAINENGVETWATNVSAVTTKLLNLGGVFNEPIVCGGCPVLPGYAVLADDCGIAFLPADEVNGVIDTCLADQAEEGDWVASLEAGARLQELVDIEAMIEERNRKDLGE